MWVLIGGPNDDNSHLRCNFAYSDIFISFFHPEILFPEVLVLRQTNIS